MRCEHEHGRGLERSLVKCNSFSSYVREQGRTGAPDQRKKKAEAFDGVLHGFSDGFVVELIGGLRVKSFFQKKTLGKRYWCVCVWLQWSKNTFVLGEGTRAKELMCVCKN
jgi:hypothetical protein